MYYIIYFKGAFLYKVEYSLLLTIPLASLRGLSGWRIKKLLNVRFLGLLYLGGSRKIPPTKIPSSENSTHIKFHPTID